MRTAAAVLFVVLSITSAAPAQERERERVGSIAGLHLYSSFWVNLHHRLHADARDGKNRIDVNALTPEDRAAWTAALDVYARDLAKRDLRTGPDMTLITGRLSSAGPSLEPAGLNEDHRRALEAAAPVYRRHRWSQDDLANRAWIAVVVEDIERLQQRVLPRLAEFYRTPWYSEVNAVRVDVVYVGAARGGYTWTVPRVQSVIDAAEPAYRGWLGTEMTLHEASHGLTGPLMAALVDAARAAKKDITDLWHAVQFFVVGEVMRRALGSEGVTFTPYLYETGLFDRAWPREKPAIETHVGAWLDGRVMWDDAIRTLVEAIGR